MKFHDCDILISPVITEKAYKAEPSEKVTFIVHRFANKAQIAKAFTKLFNMEVKAVNTINMKGTSRRVRGIKGKTAAYKKAIITLANGAKLNLLNFIETE
jgi:large subunit ribosomal protein L23